MQHSSMAITAAGSTLWELAYLTVPTIAIVVADNQAVMLESPLNDWFDTIDARTNVEKAVTEVASASQILYHNGKARRERRALLGRIGVGKKAATICNVFDETFERAS